MEIYGGFSTTSGAATEVGLPEFELLELSGAANCPNLPSGSTGCFVLVNNSDYAVTGFAVGNTDALSDGTTRTNWGADITSVNYGSGSEPSFEYFDEGGASANPLVDGSDGNFFYTTSATGSPFEVFANGPDGPVSCVGTTGGACLPASDTPEPGALSMLGARLAALLLMMRGKRM